MGGFFYPDVTLTRLARKPEVDDREVEREREREREKERKREYCDRSVRRYASDVDVSRSHPR
jgi:hypothetical protein